MKIDPTLLHPLHGCVVVRRTARADIPLPDKEHKLIVDAPADPQTTPYWGELVSIGEPRKDRAGNKVPGAIARGWQEGDIVVALFGFPRMQLDGGYFILDDFDMLCRAVKKGNGKGTLEPWFGRLIVEPDDARGAYKSDIIALPDSMAEHTRASSRPQKTQCGSGRVLTTSPFIYEHTEESKGGGPRTTKSFDTVPEDEIGISAGDRVVWLLQAMWKFNVAGRDLWTVETKHVYGKLAPDAGAIA